MEFGKPLCERGFIILWPSWWRIKAASIQHLSRGNAQTHSPRVRSIYEVATATAAHSHLPTCKMMRKQYSDASLKTPERGEGVCGIMRPEPWS